MKKEDFTKITSNYDSHRPLLWEALEATKGLVIEMGMGFGSTPYLAGYCKVAKRTLISYENNLSWFEKFNEYTHERKLITDWNVVYEQHPCPDVLFIDHAPGERRKVDIQLFSHTAKIIVAHDTEPAADHGYRMRAELNKFKYCIDLQTNGAWATAVSNFIDVSKWTPCV